MRLRLDDKRSVDFNPQRHPHLDHGYAVTSHSSQGQTADRVLVHVDTELGAKDLLNSGCPLVFTTLPRGHEVLTPSNPDVGLLFSHSRTNSGSQGIFLWRRRSPAKISRPCQQLRMVRGTFAEKPMGQESSLERLRKRGNGNSSGTACCNYRGRLQQNKRLEDGESAGARTQDQRLKRAMLYQLELRSQTTSSS